MTSGAEETGLAEVLGRHIVVDERGMGLRATWRPARGFVNVSLWRDDRCVETFHLRPDAASELVAFLVRGLAASVPAPTRPALHVVGPDAHERPRRLGLRRLLDDFRRGLADDVEALATWLRG